MGIGPLYFNPFPVPHATAMTPCHVRNPCPPPPRPSSSPRSIANPIAYPMGNRVVPAKLTLQVAELGAGAVGDVSPAVDLGMWESLPEPHAAL
jgi:hypothetical protein